MTDRRSPAERSLAARRAAYLRWASVPDPAAGTAAARQAFRDHFERLADPEGRLAPVERALRAERLRKAHMADLSRRAAQARRERKAGPQP